MSRRVLICGDRNWANRSMIERVIHDLDREDPYTEIIVGDARGADALAYEAAAARGMRVYRCIADWHLYGRAAGPKRNHDMLDLEPERVIAFHANLAASRGTADTVKQARRRGIPVTVMSGQ